MAERSPLKLAPRFVKSRNYRIAHEERATVLDDGLIDPRDLMVYRTMVGESKVDLRRTPLVMLDEAAVVSTGVRRRGRARTPGRGVPAPKPEKKGMLQRSPVARAVGAGARDLKSIKQRSPVMRAAGGLLGGAGQFVRGVAGAEGKEGSLAHKAGQWVRRNPKKTALATAGALAGGVPGAVGGLAVAGLGKLLGHVRQLRKAGESAGLSGHDAIKYAYKAASQSKAAKEVADRAGIEPDELQQRIQQAHQRDQARRAEQPAEQPAAEPAAEQPAAPAEPEVAQGEPDSTPEQPSAEQPPQDPTQRRPGMFGRMAGVARRGVEFMQQRQAQAKADHRAAQDAAHQAMSDFEDEHGPGAGDDPNLAQQAKQRVQLAVARATGGRKMLDGKKLDAFHQELEASPRTQRRRQEKADQRDADAIMQGIQDREAGEAERRAQAKAQAKADAAQQLSPAEAAQRAKADREAKVAAKRDAEAQAQAAQADAEAKAQADREGVAQEVGADPEKIQGEPEEIRAKRAERAERQAGPGGDEAAMRAKMAKRAEELKAKRAAHAAKAGEAGVPAEHYPKEPGAQAEIAQKQQARAEKAKTLKRAPGDIEVEKQQKADAAAGEEMAKQVLAPDQPGDSEPYPMKPDAEAEVKAKVAEKPGGGDEGGAKASGGSGGKSPSHVATIPADQPTPEGMTSVNRGDTKDIYDPAKKKAGGPRGPAYGSGEGSQEPVGAGSKAESLDRLNRFRTSTRFKLLAV